MSNNNGWIKLHRQLIESEIFASQIGLKIWIWCLIKAFHKKAFIPIKIGKGESIITVERGSFIFGRYTAEKELNINGSTVYKWIKKLQEMEMIEIESNSHYSIITICNYDGYQRSDEQEVTAIEQPLNSQATAIEQPRNSHVTTIKQPRNTYNNDKNVNNIENIKNDENEIKNTGTERKKNNVIIDSLNDNINTKNEIIKKDSAKADIYPFEEFWNDYDKKVGSKDKLIPKWKRLSDNDKVIIREYIPLYKNAQPDKKFRKNPETFINNKSWNDEIIKDSTGKNVFGKAVKGGITDSYKDSVYRRLGVHPMVDNSTDKVYKEF